MKVRLVQVHNFRSIKNLSIRLDDYILLVGENNVGKTSLITALRMFYEDGGLKFNQDIDFPKFSTDDQESWVEIDYWTTEDEQQSLKDEYRSSDHILRVRKYFASDNKNHVKSNQSNIYAYEDGELSQSLFYGAKNISQAKLGSVIFIPEVSKLDDTLKLSGPSPFRDMVNFVMKRAIIGSDAYAELEHAFTKFNEEFRNPATQDGLSIKTLVEGINEDLANWQVRFGVDINQIRPDDIVKTLLNHYIEDGNLDQQRVNLSSYGQGLQRHLIYTLIRHSARLTEERQEKKKDFSPDLTLLLFEEPEAFLHPSQQNRLNASLRALAQGQEQQILITTHSPHFVSKNVIDLPSIVRLNKLGPETCSYQVSSEDLARIVDENLGLYRKFSAMLDAPSVSESVKNKIRNKTLGEDTPDEDGRLEEESINYLLWLNPERAALFFAKHVVICEGMSEKVLFDFLVDQYWHDIQDQHVYFVDALGKFSIHRYIGLLSKLGIRHSVFMDRDKDAEIHEIINDFIEKQRTSFTNSIFTCKPDLESFLQIDSARRREMKPLHIISQMRAGKISAAKTEELRGVLEGLLKGEEGQTEDPK